MKKGFLIPMLLISAFVIASCAQEKIDYSENYGFSLKVKAEGEFTQVKSSAQEVDVNQFKIRITDAESILVKSWEKFSEMPSVVTLQPGNYSIQAISPENEPVAFEQPIYEGLQEFAVVPGNIAVLDLTCSLNNMKVTIAPTERFYKELNDDFTIIVTSEIGHLVFDKEVTQAGKSGFFKVTPTLEVHIQGTRKANDAPVNHHITIKDCKAKDHHVLKIDAMETGDITFGESGILIDYSVNNRDEDVFIDGWDEEDLDDDEGGETDPDPDQPVEVPITIEAPGIAEPLELNNEEAKNAVVDVKITAEHGIQELWVNIQSEVLEPMLDGMGLPKKFNMADLSDPAVKEFIKGLGLLANGEVAGATSYSFSIGAFMTLIPVEPDKSPIHTFVITVKDAQNNEKSASIVVKRVN